MGDVLKLSPSVSHTLAGNKNSPKLIYVHFTIVMIWSEGVEGCCGHATSMTQQPHNPTPSSPSSSHQENASNYYIH